MNREWKEYVVRQYHQVLYNGSWGSDDCEWDWETGETVFTDEESATEYLHTIMPSNDTPIARMYNITRDRYGIIDEELIEEVS